MEKLAVCVQLSEPVLLVGETGTGINTVQGCINSAGKTTAVQYLADLMGQELVVLVNKRSP